LDFHIRLSRTAVAPGLRTHIEKPKLGDIPFVTAWSPSGYLIEAAEQLECSEHQESSFQGTHQPTGRTVVEPKG